MTWHFDADGETFDAYDPSGSQFATGVPFSGSWSGAAPPELYVEAAGHLANAPDTNTALQWAGELIADQIAEGTP